MTSTGLFAAVALLGLASCGSRSSLIGGGPAGADGGAGSTPAGGAGGGGSGGGVLPVCHLDLASPPSIPLHAFPEGGADSPALVVLHPGAAEGPSGPEVARVASQARSNDANFWHPEIRIAELAVDLPWPDGVSMSHAPTLAGIDSHGWGRLAAGANGGLALFWHRGDEAAGLPTGIKLRAFDTTSWGSGAETFIDPEGYSPHEIRAAKLDGTASGPPGYIASWTRWEAASALVAYVAVFDAAGSFTMGPVAVGAEEDSPRTFADVIWTGETHLVAVGATVCQEGGPPCSPGAMNILRLVPGSPMGDAGVELVASIPLVSPEAFPRRPSFARTGNSLWVTWSEVDGAVEPPTRRMRIARLDPAGNVVGAPETLADGAAAGTSMISTGTESDLLIAWGEIVDESLPPGQVGHSRVVVHHRDAEEKEIDAPILVDTASFANQASLSIVGLQRPRAFLVTWAAYREDGLEEITYLSRLDCSDTN
jgi:hypothetical protein